MHFVHLLLRSLDVPGAKVPRYLYYIMEEILSNSALVGRCYSSMTRALLPWRLDYTCTAVGGEEPGLWKQGGSHSLMIRMIRTRLEGVLKAINKVGCFQERKPAWTWQSTSVSGARAAAEKAQKATQLCSTAWFSFSHFDHFWPSNCQSLSSNQNSAMGRTGFGHRRDFQSDPWLCFLLFLFDPGWSRADPHSRLLVRGRQPGKSETNGHEWQSWKKRIDGDFWLDFKGHLRLVFFSFDHVWTESCEPALHYASLCCFTSVLPWFSCLLLY